jgi:hypothetical protein
LNDAGLLAITRWEFVEPREAIRIVTIAMAAFAKRGTPNCSQNIAVISSGPLQNSGTRVSVLIKKTPFSTSEQTSIKQYVLNSSQLELLYLPSEHSLSNTFGELLRCHDLASFVEDYKHRIAPVYDSAPFFFYNLKPSRMLHPGSLLNGIDWKMNVGVYILIVLFLFTFISVLLLVWLPAHFGKFASSSRAPLLYFALIGLGYMIVEIVLVQRFILFLGHPTYALTVTICFLLISSGIGSLVWCRHVNQPHWPFICIVLLLLSCVYILPRVTYTLFGVHLLLKVMISACLICPLGFFMGIPLPLGINFLKSDHLEPGADNSPQGVEQAWAINCAASVCGSILAIIISLQLNLSAALIFGALLYFCAGLFAKRLYTVTS